MQDRITTFVAHNSRISPDRFLQLAMNTEELVMDVGTVLDGSAAVRKDLLTRWDLCQMLYRVFMT